MSDTVKATTVNLKLRVASTARTDTAELLSRLEGAGFHLRHQLLEIGVVTGWAEATQRDAIAAVDGVEDLVEDPSVVIPPMDGSTPQ